MTETKGFLRKPWLLLPAKWAHDLGPFALQLYGMFVERPTPVWRSLVWRGLVFKNPLGIAGGVDKNADNLPAWWSLGCGFVEVGTVTPLPQEPNEGRIIDRHLPSRSLWNRMGFPSAGASEVLANLLALKPYRTPVFVNIGKNRATPNEAAADDYVSLIRAFAPAADVFVVNISSPNTKGLRDLQSAHALRSLLQPVVKEAAQVGRPLLVKLSPDMEDAALAEAAEVAVSAGVDGFVLTNTTLSRPSGVPYPPEGGMSGEPLKEKSLAALRLVVKTLGARREGKLIVSVGGIMTAGDVFARLKEGADLVQVYSALIVEGPGFIRTVANGETAAPRNP